MKSIFKVGLNNPWIPKNTLITYNWDNTVIIDFTTKKSLICTYHIQGKEEQLGLVKYNT